MNLVLRDMCATDLELVLHIERQAHRHPWTEGNFLDAMQAGYACKAVFFAGELTGYAVLMLGVDEAELLNISIAPTQQRRGLGRQLLRAMLTLARTQNKLRVLLEVRASNNAAINLYQTTGFQRIAVRRAYYVAASGREDAIIMDCVL